MKTLWRLGAAIAVTLCSLTAEAANTYPIVLVHGFSGWGRDELFGLKYWGGGFSGSRDIQSVLTANGTPTYTAAVGPISSNYDRAIELFYQIKGGCVDYGPYHSTHLQKRDGTIDSRPHIRLLDGGLNTDGTRRPRRCWAASASNNPNNDPLALYPQWGVDPTKKIHLISHSQGGQTVRVLLQLLRNGSPNEIAADATLSNESVQKNPFTGGKNWVSSITTLSTPHDGTSLDSVIDVLPLVQQVVAGAAAVAGLVSSDSVVYDLKLDQWGLRRNAGESFTSYFNRVKASPIWNDQKDLSIWDLSPDGAKELNQRVQHFNDVYYFSYATQTTYTGLFSGRQYPILTTFLPFQPQTLLMGFYTRNDPNKVPIDSSWWANDSVVNTRSQRVPTLGSASPSVNFTGTPQIGTWNYMALYKNWDHLDIVGLFSERGPSTINNSIYIPQANRLKALSN